ncbi:GntR family transcriptional regulator / MocR family aminotransferase [Stutzerimonas kunmingensis]|uniref:MocR-like pyridoxine biosynthesis transcription factor PdxR n=1 Tax=Stutzerimonas kunmingensis TaxID=1211807 RepID=UPI0008E7AC1A|nr:PLP-dependent aminotransferase family protein [Stutzerimonas kunmingensis]MCQ2044297.1 PLP-dependent aminotransferase family protein [Stutzerimonas kunmingensis]SFJ92926.1 GntR family transcriptional regulator / MocR family aminotransferase [Stutzerimonas kunmingensis]
MPTTPPLPVDLSGICLERSRGLTRQLYQALRERILDGRLAGGSRLPAGRDLAALLAVSRNTVTRAFDQLYAEGYIEGRVGDGTYVVELGSARPLMQSSASGVAPTEALLRLQRNHLAPPVSGAPRAFRIGVPAFDLFPFEIWARLTARFWRKPSPARLGYGDPAGEPALRELVAAYLRSSRGLNCDPSQVVITCGAQQGISLCAQLLVQPGDRVALENPGYRAAGHAFAVAGAELCGVAVDGEGLDTAALAQIEGCRLAYVTPSHQYPTGVTLSLARRLELLAWAERNEGWIVEDDYDGEYRYSGTPLTPLAALDRQGRVLYVGTFCKITFPALRLGYLVLPPGLAEAFARRRALDMRHSDIGSQMVMAEFIAAGHFQRHVRRMRQAARVRRDTLLQHWPEAIPGCAELPAVDAGLHLCVPVHSHAREAELVAAARAAEVEMNGLADYWLDGQAPRGAPGGLVLGFAAVPEVEIIAALQRLRHAWDLPS